RLFAVRSAQASELLRAAHPAAASGCEKDTNARRCGHESSMGGWGGGFANPQNSALCHGVLACASGFEQFQKLFFANIGFRNRQRRGRIAHWQLIADDAIELIECAGDAGSSRHEADFADAARPVRALRILFFDED